MTPISRKCWRSAPDPPTLSMRATSPISSEPRVEASACFWLLSMCCLLSPKAPKSPICSVPLPILPHSAEKLAQTDVLGRSFLNDLSGHGHERQMPACCSPDLSPSCGSGRNIRADGKDPIGKSPESAGTTCREAEMAQGRIGEHPGQKALDRQRQSLFPFRSWSTGLGSTERKSCRKRSSCWQAVFLPYHG